MSQAMEGREDLEALIGVFDEYLRRIGYAAIPGARRMRQERIKRFRDLLRREGRLERLAAGMEEYLAKADVGEQEILREIQDFLRKLQPAAPPSFPAEEALAPETIAVAPVVSPLPFIGRVAPTQDTPAGHQEFCFWAETKAQLGIGEIVTAASPDGSVTIVGVVQDLQTVTHLQNPIAHFWACDMGHPEAELPTEIPVIPLGRVRDSLAFRRSLRPA